MRRACLVATLGLLAVAAGCGGSHAALRPCTLRMSGLGSLRYDGGLLAEMSDGSLVVGVAQEHGHTLTVVLHRVDTSCKRVTSFGTNGVATVSLTAKTGPFGYFGTSIDVIAADPDGGLILGGSEGPHELVGRLLGNGQLDDLFGDGGWARIDSHERPSEWSRYAGVISIAFAPSGSILLGGHDGGARCCSLSFVTELTTSGAPVTSFGNGGTTFVPKFAGSYVTELAPNSDGSVYLYLEYEQSGESIPKAVLVRRDGSLDRSFDTAVARSIRSVANRNVRFTPTLVPGSGGGFVLVGGLDRGFPPFGTHELSRGIAVRVARSGRIVGKTPFASAQYEFDNPAAIRLPSGGIVAAVPVYGSDYNVDSVLVQSLSPDGSTAGRQRIVRSKIPRRGHIVGLVPAPGGAWLAMANTKEFEFVPIATG